MFVTPFKFPSELLFECQKLLLVRQRTHTISVFFVSPKASVDLLTPTSEARSLDERNIGSLSKLGREYFKHPKMPPIS